MTTRKRAGQLLSFDGIFFLIAVFAIVVGFIYSWNILTSGLTSSLEDFRAYRMANAAADRLILDPDSGVAVRDSHGSARDHLIQASRRPPSLAFLRTHDVSIEVEKTILIESQSGEKKKNAWCAPRVAADSVSGKLLLLESCYYYDSI